MNHIVTTDSYFEASYYNYLIIKNDLNSWKNCRIYRNNRLIYSVRYAKQAERYVNESIRKITGFRFPEVSELNVNVENTEVDLI